MAKNQLYGTLPKMSYNGVLIADITHKFNTTKIVNTYSNSYFQLDIREGDSPEAVSLSAYGTIDYWWLVLISNNVIDPFYDWLMSEREVYAYSEKVYDNINDIHHWEDTEYNIYEYDNAEATRVPITNIEWEIYKNDTKRRVSLVRPEDLFKIEKELKKLIKEIPTVTVNR
jgi:hypothetical protein